MSVQLKNRLVVEVKSWIAVVQALCSVVIIGSSQQKFFSLPNSYFYTYQPS
jgi:hypothetical protein